MVQPWSMIDWSTRTTYGHSVVSGRENVTSVHVDVDDSVAVRIHQRATVERKGKVQINYWDSVDTC